MWIPAVRTRAYLAFKAIGFKMASMSPAMAICVLLCSVTSCDRPGISSSDFSETVSDEEWVPTEDELASVPGRYRIVVDGIGGGGRRSHLLLDTATGSVWAAKIKPASGVLDRMRAPVGSWQPISIQPLPAAVVAEAGRFEIAFGQGDSPDRFLLDSVSGETWTISIAQNQEVVIAGIAALQPPGDGSAEPEVDIQDQGSEGGGK